jgi:hypothetical protein
LKGDLNDDSYAYYAYSDDSTWEGESDYYVDPVKAFTYDANDQPVVNGLEQQGYEIHGFKLIETQGATSYVQQLQ